MATPATLNSGKANRRFVLLAVVLGLLGAVLVYAAFSRDSSSDSSLEVAGIPVVVASVEIPARTRITNEMIEVVLLPPAFRSELAYSDISEVTGQVTRYPVNVNDQVTSTKLIAAGAGVGISRSLSYTIPEGMRGIAIQASEIANAGGLILPGDYVDILIIYDFPTESYFVQTLMQNVEILAVSQTVVDTIPEAEPAENGQRARNSEALPNADANTVTIAVTPEDAQLIYLAESKGRFRLTVRPFGDGDEERIDFLVETDLYPSNLSSSVTQ